MNPNNCGINMVRVAEVNASAVLIGIRSSLKYLVSGRRCAELANRTQMSIARYAGLNPASHHKLRGV